MEFGHPNGKRKMGSCFFKKDDPLEKENYRPVTVQMTVNKIFEQLLAKQVPDNLDNRLGDFQTAKGTAVKQHKLCL